MRTCPSPEQLRQVLTGQLCGPEVEAIKEHVEACPSCRQVLEELTDTAGLHRNPPADVTSVGGPGASFLSRLERAVLQDPAVGVSDDRKVRVTGDAAASNALPTLTARKDEPDRGGADPGEAGAVGDSVLMPDTRLERTGPFPGVSG